MSFRKLSEAELSRVEAWMKTPEFAERVAVARGRHAAGEPFNFERLAKELDLPIEIVLAIFSEVAAASGLDVRPVGKAN